MLMCCAPGWRVQWHAAHLLLSATTGFSVGRLEEVEKRIDPGNQIGNGHCHPATTIYELEELISCFWSAHVLERFNARRVHAIAPAANNEATPLDLASEELELRSGKEQDAIRANGENLSKSRSR